MPSSGLCKSLIESRHRKDGFGTPENPEKFCNQDYQQLKKFCLAKRVRYIDEMFPPDHQTIGDGILNSSDMAKVMWLRPGKIVPDASFVVDGVSRFDFGQGIVGDCWFLASAGALTFQTHILGQVVPLEQRFDVDYCGIFHFRFWRFGRWVDVVIDDKLPTINGRLLFVHSKDPTEFWPALLEKAYAKVCGSYSDMNAGTPAEALVDFTGGVHICVNLSDPPSALWEMICRAGQSKSLMGCGTPQGETSANTVLPNGLVQGHAYAVTGVKELIYQGQRIQLVRVWNPWGQGEWKGDWSDQSSLWESVSPQDREMCLSMRNDGEFWMTLEDFLRFYSDLDICCLCPDFLDGGDTCHWKTSFYEGRWVAGTTAGGCMNNPDSFWCNPQYRVTVENLLGECAKSSGENNMLVSLMQKPDKRNRRLVKNLFIGFSIFKIPEEYKDTEGKFEAAFFNTNRPVAQTKTFVNGREVMEFLNMTAGEYLIVPCTFNPNETASFILTILAKAETHVHEHFGGQNHNHNHNHNHDHDHDHDHNSGNHENMDTVKPQPEQMNEDVRSLFQRYADKRVELDAESLQVILNNHLLKGQSDGGGFSIDSCRSIVALSDTSINGKLDIEEFARLWKKAFIYKGIFSIADASQTGTLQVAELRKAIMATGLQVSEKLVKLLSLRYFTSSESITVESFICLVLRLDCMRQLFSQLTDGMMIHLREKEWLQLTMYS